MSDLIQAFGEPYFQRSLAMVTMLGVVGGVAGTHVLLRRLSFYVVALSHATFPALVLAGMAGISTMLGGIAGGVIVAAAVSVIGRRPIVGHSNAIAVVLGSAFALGIALVTAAPNAVDPTAVLVGSLVGVDGSDLRNTAMVAIACLIGFAALHKEFVFGAFDSTGASAAGYRTAMLDFALLILVAMVVVASIPAVGALMSITLVITPALAGRALSDRLLPAMGLSVGLALVSGFGGLLASASLALATGGTIAVISVLVLAACLAWRRFGPMPRPT